jgi:hypothetical protein
MIQTVRRSFEEGADDEEDESNSPYDTHDPYA